MDLLIPAILVLHVFPAAFWLGVTGVIAKLGSSATSLPLRTPQLASSIGAMMFGSMLWWIMYGASFGPDTQILAGGAFCALIAFAIQQGIAWPAAARSPKDFATAQRVSAVLLSLATISMVLFRFVP